MFKSSSTSLNAFPPSPHLSNCPLTSIPTSTVLDQLMSHEGFLTAPYFAPNLTNLHNGQTGISNHKAHHSPSCFHSLLAPSPFRQFWNSFVQHKRLFSGCLWPMSWPHLHHTPCWAHRCSQEGLWLCLLCIFHKESIIIFFFSLPKSGRIIVSLHFVLSRLLHLINLKVPDFLTDSWKG